MIRTTPILCVILIAISLTLSGCVDPNAPEGNTSAPTPTPTHIDADSGAAMPTPTLASMSTPTPTSNATDNATEDKSDWDVCDSRHNASWLYMHGCIGNGGGGGHHYHRSSVNDPIPELPTGLLVLSGIVGLVAFYRRM